MRKYYVLLLFVICLTTTAQMVRPLFSLAIDKNTQFENNSFANLAAGIEVKFGNLFKPQIEFGYTKALLYDNNTYNDDFQINAVSQASFVSYSIACTPKLTVFQTKTRFTSINFLPKYTYSQIVANNDYAAILPNGDVVLPFKSNQSAANLHSFGLGIGFCVNFGKKNYDSIAINLYWNNIEYGSVINNLQNMSRTIDTSSGVGFGLVYYVSLKDNIEKGFLEPK